MRHRFLRSTLSILALGLMAGSGLVACSSNSNAEEAQAEREPTEKPSVATEKAAGTAVDEAAADKPIRIAQGTRVDLAAHLAEGQITVFDFMSDYCPPCVQISPWLDRLHAERDDIQVVKIDVNRPGVKGIDWQSPTLAQFGIRSIPHFKIYGADGELMNEGNPAYEQIVDWLKNLPQQGR